MQIEMGGGLAINLPEEGQELVCPMAGQTFADDFAGRDVERGKKRRSAVALIIMGHGSGAAFLQRQAWLGAIESWRRAFRSSMRITTKAPGYNGIMAPGIPE